MLNGNFQGQSGDFVTDENFNNILNQLFQMYSKYVLFYCFFFKFLFNHFYKEKEILLHQRMKLKI